MDATLIKKSRRHAWCIVGVGFLVYFFIYGSAYNCVGLFLDPMAESFGVSRAVISGLFTIMQLVAIPAAMIFGRIADKKDLKWPMAICCALVGIGYIMYATVKSIGLVYVAAALIGVGVAGTIQIPAAIFISGWFIKKKGLAMGFTMVGSGVGGTILSQILSRVIVASGWEFAYLLLGILVLVITVPLTIIFVTKTPSMKGMLRYGEEDEEYVAKIEKEERIKAAGGKGNIKEIFSKPEFWCLFVGILFIILPMSAWKQHVVAYMTDIGYSPIAAANILTIMVFTVIPGKPCTGWFYDKLDARVATFICGACMAGGIFLALASSLGVGIAIAFSAIYGFGSAIASVGLPLMLQDTVYSGANFAMAFSVINMAFNVGAAFGPTIMALLQEAFGSYVIALICAGIIISLGIILAIVAMTMGRHRRAKAVQEL